MADWATSVYLDTVEKRDAHETSPLISVDRSTMPI